MFLSCSVTDAPFSAFDEQFHGAAWQKPLRSSDQSVSHFDSDGPYTSRSIRIDAQRGYFSLSEQFLVFAESEKQAISLLEK